MTKANQFTEVEANKICVGSSLNFDTTLYMQGENWGDEDEIGSFDDWDYVIPEKEDEARMTGYYDWYMDSDQEKDGGGVVEWDEYREKLMKQLRQIEII